MGAAFSRLNYHLGTATFEPLDQGGWANVISVFGLHPIVRTRNLNVFAQGAFDSRDFEDEFRGAAFVVDKKIKVGTIGVVGDSRDSYLGGGINNFSLSVTRGKLDVDATLPSNQVLSGVGPDGYYSRFNGSMARLNALFDSTVLYLSYAFQLASKNLDVSEKLSLGGPTGVRAYPVGEASADEAHLFTAEVRYGLAPRDSIPGNVVLSAFVDVGHAKFNEDPFPEQTTPNTRTLSAAGFGAIWGRQDDFSIRASLAWRLSGRPTSDTSDRKPRLYVQASKYF
jgi:hemolysin activation/secretion protein